MKRNKKIHVVYIITKLELGGAQKVCLSLFHGLQKNNIHTTLISGAQGILVDSVKHSDNVLLLDNLKREVFFKGMWHEFLCFFQLIKQLKKLKKKSPHLIVHTHSTKAGILGRWAAFFARIKIRIHTVHGFGFHAHQNRLVWFFIYVLELLTSFITTHYVCVSSEDVKTGINLLPGFAKKHSIIRAAIDWNQFYIPARIISPDSTANEYFIFGTVACFKPQKNIVDVLQAFEQVHQQYPQARLEIIGDGILRPSIESWITNHNFNNAITLHGWQKQVVPIMSRWHAFVLSSLWEGLPCAVVEACALKLPVVSYNTGGIHDIIFHNHNGLLYTKGNWTALARGMGTLIKDNHFYMKLSNYQHNLQDFHHTTMLQNHIQLYKHI